MRPTDPLVDPPSLDPLLRRHFQLLLEALPVPAYTCDAEGAITGFNKEIVTLWGRTPEPGNPADRWCSSLRHRSVEDNSLIDHDECWMALILRTGEAQSQEVIIERLDGSRVRVLAQGNPVYDTAGKLYGAVGVLTDIGDRRQAELAQARLSAIVASSDDAIVSKTLDGVVLSWNAAAERLFGFTADEAIGQPITLIIPPERRSEEGEILGKLVRGERVEHYETIRATKDGKLLDISLTSSPVRDATGRIVGASKIARDITARKRDEESLRRLHEELRQVDQVKNDFLATLAHELRNPLAPIRNLIYVLKSSTAPLKEMPSALDVMDRQLTHMARLVDDLTDISRISKNKFELRREPFDLRLAIETAIEAIEPLLKEKDHRFTVTIPNEALMVDGDLTRLTQAVGNVLNNAAKYTPYGGMITLTMRPDGPNAAVTVTDTGVGIPPDMLERIFEMFVQVDASANRGHGGLGLGLHLARKMTEMHGGTLTVISGGVDQGSSFCFCLPLATTAPVSLAESPETDAAAAVSRLRVLVIDDNRDAADSLCMVLQVLGYTARAAYDGPSALLEGAEYKPATVLLDIGLPVMDGYEVARRIRSEPWGRSVRLCALTGWGHQDVRRQAKDAGFDAHFVKPIETAALIEAVGGNEFRTVL